MTKHLITLCVAALLSACGGGNSSAPAPVATLEVPDSASQSSAGLVSYLGALSAAADETGEPADIARFAPPQPDDTEPETLN